jgi:glycosyltransferase involved in cell wall biosynthesis
LRNHAARGLSGMRLLHVHSGNLYGGVETMMLTLARARAAAPAIVPEFALAFDGRIAAELRATGVPVHRLDEVRARNPLSVIRARRRLADVLAAGAYGAVACHMPWAQAIFAPVVRRAGVRNIFWMHGPAARRHWTERWAARTPPDFAICNSRHTAATLPRLFPHTGAEVLYCPVAIPAARQSAAERLAVRNEIGAARDAAVIVQVGRMEALKGHALLLRALATLRHRDWVCWQIGEAQRPEELSYLNGLKRLADELGVGDRVKFLGHRSDVIRLLEAADIYCQPNIAPDAFGISYIEALGARLPVVTTALGGALEIVDESCGVLVAPLKADALAAALARLLDDDGLRRRLGAAGPARAAALCDPPMILRRMEKMVEGLNQSKLAS